MDERYSNQRIENPVSEIFVPIDSCMCMMTIEFLQAGVCQRLPGVNILVQPRALREVLSCSRISQGIPTLCFLSTRLSHGCGV